MANRIDSVGFFAAELLDQAAREHPNRTAIIDKEEELSFAVLNGRVHALAGHLQREGIKQSDRVGVLLPNCAAIPLIYFASQKIGAVSVLFDARLRGRSYRAFCAMRISSSWLSISSWCLKCPLYLKSSPAASMDCPRPGRRGI